MVIALFWGDKMMRLADSSFHSPDPSTEFLTAQDYEIVHDTLQQIDLVNRLITSFPQQLLHAYSAADIMANFKADRRKISSLMGAEGLHQIGGSASILRL